LAIGDPHFTASNAKETEYLTDEIGRILDENQIEHVIILGDTLDRHETVNTNVLFRVKLLFDLILSKSKQLYVLIGNHDIPNNKIYMSEVHPFMHWDTPELHIVNKTSMFTISGMDFLMVPYVPPGKFAKAIEGFPTPRCIFAHQEFKGCKMGSIVSEDGDPLPDIDIISGHIHDRQRIGKLYYPGTPYQTNMGESTDKGVSIFKFNENRIDEIRLPLNIPKKITLDITASQLLSWVSPDSFNRYRLTVHGSNTEFLTLSKSGIISDLTKKGVKITYKEIKQHVGKIERREKLNFMDVFMKKIYENDMKDEMLKIIQEIYK